MKIENIETFYYLCKTRSFLDTSTRLKLDKSSISRRIAALEKELGHKLLERTHGDIEPTERGAYFLESAGSLLKQYYETLDQLNDFGGELSGSFTISTTHALCSTWLSEVIGPWIEAHPKVDVNLVCSNDPPDLAMKGADVMLRPKIQDPTLVQEYVRSWNIYLYGSTDYLSRFGTPNSMKDLKNHRLIAFGDAPNLYSRNHVEWHLGNSNYKPFLRVNSLESLFRLVEKGVGIGTITDEYPGIENLIPLLHTEIAYETKLYFIYQRQKSSSPVLNSFRDFISQFKIQDDSKVH